MYRRLTRLLREAGYELKREGKGSHGTWWNAETRRTVTVPRTIRKTGTANAILKQAGLPKAV